VWLATGFLGMRGIHVYLWHIPWVALVGVAAWQLEFDAQPLDGRWWLAHLAGLVVILGLAWPSAGLAARADRQLARLGNAWRARGLPATPFAVAIPVSLLAMTVTGLGTWWRVAFLGIPTSSVLNLVVLVVAWSALAAGLRAPHRPQ
jgi:hypothetical protein